ncbi:TolB family protein [Pseudolysinimonas sp.]|uniref:TolB family protein n=1 Tax=Pseudolysinimonas sp. TaxID=2680009 RepID=UPI003F81E1ED
MSARARWLLLAAICVVALVVAVVFGVGAFLRARQAADAPSAVQTDHAEAGFSGPRVVFRNTASGSGYGLVASVPLADPTGPRSLSSEACDRVYSTASRIMCLRTDAGITTTWRAIQYSPRFVQQQTWSLPGVPSRTRISADSKLVASTAFVTGEAYSTVGFSTQTVIATAAGKSYGNLEDFRLIIDGRRSTSADRNIWGVTFAADDNTFYATAATSGSTWLVRGDLRTRTMTSIHQTAECPSLSPDGTRVAFKQNSGSFTDPVWQIVVYDLASGTVTPVAEHRSVDDQVDWLDDGTLLYGMPRTGAVGDDDIWKVPADGTGTASVYIPHAWSPSVVR